MRKPVRSAVANRKYFQGGGLAPMKPAAPEEAVGIMASSQPLVDMVAQNAGNPQGGMSPLNFDQGGIFSRIFNISQAKADAAERGERERANNAGLLSGTDPRRGALINLDPDQFKKLTQVTMNIPEGKSRIGQFLTTKFNLPIQSPLKGIGQFLLSKKMRQDFPTATPVQFQDINAIVRMNPGRENEIYEGAKKLITEQGFKGSGDALRKALIPILPESLESEKLLDEKFDEEAKKANEKAQKEAEGKTPKIDPIKETDEFTEIDITTPPGKEGDKFTFSFGKQTKKAEDQENIKNITGETTGEKVDQNQLDQDQQDTEVETAIDTTTKAVQENINAIKEAANTNNKKTVENNLEGYIEEFKAAMPKYEGMTEEEKGFAIIEAGLNIAAGESPNAIMNIANGLKPVLAKLAKNKEAEKAFNTQINISAAKYGIERLNNDRQRNFNLEDEMRKYMREEKTFFVSNPKGETIDGVFYKQGSPITLTNQQINDGAFEKLKGKVTSEGIMKQIISDANDFLIAVRKAEIENLGDSKVTPKDSKTLLDITEKGRTFTRDAETNVKMLAMLDVGMEYNAEKKLTGVNNYFKQKVQKLAAAAPILREIKYLDKLAKDGTKKSQFEQQQQVIANMMIKEILGEGSKNVSNIDRQLAGEIVGLLKGADTIFESDELLHQRLQRIRGRIASNLEDNIASIMDVEGQLLAIEGGKGLRSVESLRQSRSQKFKFDDPREQAISDKAMQEQFGAPIPENVLQAGDYFDLNTGAIKKKI